MIRSHDCVPQSDNSTFLIATELYSLLSLWQELWSYIYMYCIKSVILYDHQLILQICTNDTEYI